MLFEQRIAIVTGATGALGSAVVQMLLEEGATVAGLDYTEEQLAKFIAVLGAANDRFVPLQADVTDEASVGRAVKTVQDRFGRIDFLANIVGGWAGGKSVVETDPALWRRMLALNLDSAYLCCRAVVPFMLQENYGRIVSISSRTALRVSAGESAYAVGKMGVIKLTETLALELRQHDITANALLPSVIDTPANRQAMPNADFSRWVKPEEIARVIRFLFSDDAKIISGAAIPVYGKA